MVSTPHRAALPLAKTRVLAARLLQSARTPARWRQPGLSTRRGAGGHGLHGLSLAPGSCALVDTSLMFCSNHLTVAVEDTLSHTLIQLDREHVLPINFQLFWRQMKFDVAGVLMRRGAEILIGPDTGEIYFGNIS